MPVEMTRVTVEVPAGTVNVIERCAELLREGGSDAQALEDIANGEVVAIVELTEERAREIVDKGK